MKRTSTEAHVYMRRHQRAKVAHFDVSNVIYHKFSHGAVPYTLNGENVNVMLESKMTLRCLPTCFRMLFQLSRMDACREADLVPHGDLSRAIVIRTCYRQLFF